jgi:hypothetical protein
MSHPHIRVPRAAPPLKPQWHAVVTMSCFLALLGGLWFWSNVRASDFDERHSFTQGNISETRVVLDRIFDGSHGGIVSWRLEAHVSFTTEGQPQDRWLVVPTYISDHDLLMAKAAKSPKSCQVYWFPGHPDSAKCRID